MLFVEIRVDCHIDQHWSESLEGLNITHLEGDQSLLSGPITDQAALFGLLARLWDLRLSLVSIEVSEFTANGRKS
jgi:hypothetical protein